MILAKAASTLSNTADSCHPHLTICTTCSILKYRPKITTKPDEPHFSLLCVLIIDFVTGLATGLTTYPRGVAKEKGQIIEIIFVSFTCEYARI